MSLGFGSGESSHLLYDILNGGHIILLFPFLLSYLIFIELDSLDLLLKLVILRLFHLFIWLLKSIMEFLVGSLLRRLSCDVCGFGDLRDGLEDGLWLLW